MAIASKPKVKLTGMNSNTMNLLAICNKALKKAGQTKEAEELSEKVFASKSPDEAIQNMMKYCDVS